MVEILSNSVEEGKDEGLREDIFAIFSVFAAENLDVFSRSSFSPSSELVVVTLS